MPKWLDDRKLIWLVALLTALVASLYAANHPIISPDTVSRHAPMAEDFAAGRWSMAFHPRFGLGLPLVAGILRFVSGCDGLSASCFVATFAWALCAIPVFGIARMVFDRTTAWFAVILFLICPQTLMWGLKGLREPFKMLGLLLATEAVLKSRGGSWWNMARAAVSFWLLAWFKVDSVILVPCFGLAYAIGDRWSRRTWALVAAAVMILLPCCWLVYKWTGVFLPAPQYINVWRKFL